MGRHELHQSVVASEESNWIYLEGDLEAEIVLWLMNHHSINADGGEEVQLHVEWPVTSDGRFTPGEAPIDSGCLAKYATNIQAM